MASNVKIKRSATAGKIPAVADLQLGELAVNTFDGKLYLKKNNGTDQVVEIGASSSGGGGGSIAWSKKTANYTAITGDKLIADTTAGAFTITLPVSPAVGNSIILADGNDWFTTNLTIARNSQTIEGAAEDLIINIKGIQVELIFDGTTWEVFAATGPQGTGITYSVKSSNYTVKVNEGILADTSVAAFTITLPASPSTGSQLFIADAKGTWSTKSLIIERNGNTIKDQAQNMLCDLSNVSIQFVYTGTTWAVFIQAGVTNVTATSTAEVLSPFLFL